MKVSQHVQEIILDRLEQHRMVVIYDPDRTLHDLFRAIEHEPLVKVDASGSLLRARREADQAWRALFDVDSLGRHPTPLLIYLPVGRETEREARQKDPFEPFALAGAAFGDVDAERLPSIARKVLEDREGEVDRLLAANSRPTLAQLDALAGGTRYPLLLEELGTDVPSRVATWLLCRPEDIRARLRSAGGLLAELRRLLGDSYGFEPESELPFDALGPTFAQWALFSELAFDRAEVMPASLAHTPRAEPAFRTAIYELCHELRTSSEHQHSYREIASEVERRLGLLSLAGTLDTVGERDTFPFENRAALMRLQRDVLAGELTSARTLAERCRASVWRGLPEVDQLWRLAERCLDLLAAGAEWEARSVGAGRPVADHVRAYCAEDDGMWRLDQKQRLVEQAAAVLADRDTLAALLDHVRRAFRKWLEAAQDAFLDAVAKSGWPPEGLKTQTQAWADHGAGAVAEGRRTAWFLVDALRYEMGKELGAGLKSAGTVRVEPACGVVPATTAFGMAALLPGAGTALSYGLRDGKIVPLLGGRPVVTADDRRGVFRAALGDRFADLRLGDLLTSSSAQLRGTVGSADVLAVFSTEIDDLGEHSDPLVARRHISGIVADLMAAANRLIELGFERLVFAADHGFLQLPEILPGDRCGEPAGRWLLRTRRALLGQQGARTDSVIALDAASVGLQDAADQICFPRGVKVFRARHPFFHEGLSLQECLVPVVVLDAVQRQSGEDQPLVNVSYRSDRFTTRIFSVQVRFTSVTQSELSVRVGGFAPGTRETAGEAVDCQARDPHTGLVRLPVNEEVSIPIALEPDFEGDAVEVRVTDATTPGRAYASLVLRNGILG